MYRKNSKAAGILALRGKGLRAAEVARRVGTTKEYVYFIHKEVRDKEAKAKARAEAAGAKAKARAEARAKARAEARAEAKAEAEAKVEAKAEAKVEAKQDGITTVLEERGGRYGTFLGHAHVTIGLKQILHSKIAQRDLHLFPDQIEALDMICHKMGRIVNGDPNYADSWIDIAGYAKLVADRLEGKVR